jgi:hypothetical protein
VRVAYEQKEMQMRKTVMLLVVLGLMGVTGTTLWAAPRCGGCPAPAAVEEKPAGECEDKEASDGAVEEGAKEEKTECAPAAE